MKSEECVSYKYQDNSLRKSEKQCASDHWKETRNLLGARGHETSLTPGFVCVVHKPFRFIFFWFFFLEIECDKMTDFMHFMRQVCQQSNTKTQTPNKFINFTLHTYINIQRVEYIHILKKIMTLSTKN